jgi:hypothetical protein
MTMRTGNALEAVGEEEAQAAVTSSCKAVLQSIRCSVVVIEKAEHTGMEREETMRKKMAAGAAQAEDHLEEAEEAHQAEADMEALAAVMDGVTKEAEVAIEDMVGGRNSEVSPGGCGCQCIPGCLAAMATVLDSQALVLVGASAVIQAWVWEEVDHLVGLVGQSTSQGLERWLV